MRVGLREESKDVPWTRMCRAGRVEVEGSRSGGPLGSYKAAQGTSAGAEGSGMEEATPGMGNQQL